MVHSLSKPNALTFVFLSIRTACASCRSIKMLIKQTIKEHRTRPKANWKNQFNEAQLDYYVASMNKSGDLPEKKRRAELCEQRDKNRVRKQKREIETDGVMLGSLISSRLSSGGA